jgi:flagellin
MSNTVVRTNVLAINSHRSLKTVGSQQSKSSARLSSGYKINSAADDASGLAISEKMRAQIRGLDQASTNAQDAVSLIQTAEGGMQEIDNMLQRIRELVVKASNDTNDVTSGEEATGDRQKIQDEINALVTEIDEMACRVEFNNKRLIDGDYESTALHFQIGANADQNMELTIGSVTTDKLGIGGGPGASTTGALDNIANEITGADTTGLLDTLDTALTYVTTQRSKLGAAQNRLEYTQKSLDISS